MNCLRAAQKKLCFSFGNEEASDKGHKLVKIIAATAHDLNLEVDEEDGESLALHDHELTTER